MYARASMSYTTSSDFNTNRLLDLELDGYFNVGSKS